MAANGKRDLALIDAEKILTIKYEDFVQNPASEFQRVSNFLGKSLDLSSCEKLVVGVSAKSIGKGRAQLSDDEMTGIKPLIAETLEQNAYNV